MDKNKRKHAENTKRYRDKNAAKGLCESCGQCPFEEGFKKCNSCRLASAKRCLEWRQERRKNGVCRHCDNPVIPEKCYCETCRGVALAKLKEEHRKREAEGTCTRCNRPPFSNNKLCKEHYDHICEERKNRRERYEQAGMCGKCGKHAPITLNRLKWCEICYNNSWRLGYAPKHCRRLCKPCP